MPYIVGDIAKGGKKGQGEGQKRKQEETIMQNTSAKSKDKKFIFAIRSNTLEDTIYLNQLVEAGFSLSTIKNNKKIIETMIAHNVMPRKTWENATKAKNKKLSAQNSERILRVLRISEMAKQAFGEKAGIEWIERPTKIFGGKAPIAMLTNESGSRAVELFLNRTMHGFNA